MPKTSVLTSRIEPELERRLARKARQLGRSASETGAMFIDEALRRDEFAFIDFRDSPVGRQAFLQGSTLAVWEVLWIAKGYGNSADKTAAHLEIPLMKVKAAFNYANAYPKEIAEALEEHQGADFEGLSRALPQVEVFPSRKQK